MFTVFFKQRQPITGTEFCTKFTKYGLQTPQHRSVRLYRSYVSTVQTVSMDGWLADLIESAKEGERGKKER